MKEIGDDKAKGILLEALYPATEFAIDHVKLGYNVAVREMNKGFTPEQVHAILTSAVDKKDFKGCGRKKKSCKSLKKLSNKVFNLDKIIADMKEQIGLNPDRLFTKPIN